MQQAKLNLFYQCQSAQVIYEQLSDFLDLCFVQDFNQELANTLQKKINPLLLQTSDLTIRQKLFRAISMCLTMGLASKQPVQIALQYQSFMKEWQERISQ
ncbi:Hypothetical_protein [Hexamita inflata]|uniref:Hypothetical_protein n=1 Tax=Hexamita inflata TaxID=28002 RepID=A0AA86V6P6_9EUKA|nr:Hypothetical protein HINF_LOCUS66211 [Hexamita inflata]